jgi:hypothetical protein
MGRRARRLTAATLITAIALQGVLLGLVAQAAAAAPSGTIICHADASGAGDHQVPTPAAVDDCCISCILSSTLSAAQPPATPAVAAHFSLRGEKLVPRSTAEEAVLPVTGTNLPRGPPPIC